MEEVPLPLNISIQLGDDKEKNLQNLARVKIANYAGHEAVKKIIQKSNIKEEVGEDLLMVFNYSIQQGRQKQAEQYFRLAFDKELNKNEMSPLQFLSTKPPKGDVGKATVSSSTGRVTVIYRLNKQHIENQTNAIIFSSIENFHTLKIDVELKGYVSHSLKNRTNVKVDYAKINISSEYLDSDILHNIYISNQLVPEEIISNSFFNMFGKAKKINLNLQFKSFRQINKYYQDILKFNEKKEKKDPENFKYQNNGLFRESAEAYIIYSDKVALTGDILHHGEDVFLRLVKVYFKALKKAASEI